MPFEMLSPWLAEMLLKRGITEPTPPQADAIPKIIDGQNVLLIAPTGIGKTEAAILPVLDELKKNGGNGFQCLYITPLRALNRDMLERLQGYGKESGITVGVRHGDTSQSERNQQSRNPPQILITTPETVQVLFTGKNLREHLKNIRWVIVDEVHELADNERGAQLSVALERLSRLSGEYQRIGLSATVGNAEEVKNFLAGIGRDITVCRHDTHRDYDISVECPASDDESVLIDRLQTDPEMLGVMKHGRRLIEDSQSTLFFVNTRETAEWLAARYRLWDEEFPIDVHHGSLSKETRMEMEDRFKGGDLKALLCTSSLELGIDVGSTDLVIQFNSPRQVSRMIQRAGRAGHRIGELIKARILAVAPDEVAEAMVIARKSENREIESLEGRKSPLTVVANQLVAMTMAEKMDRDTAFNTFRRSYPFSNLERQEMDDVIEQLKSIKVIFEDEDGFRRSRRGMNYFYSNISMIPDERTYWIRDIGTRSVIGTLDESFVATFAEEYAMFIAKGRTWRIVEMREDEILVEEAKEIGAVPSWTGSDIPVPFDIAMEVGRMRRLRNYDDYPCDQGSKDTVEKFLDSQKEHVMPTDRMVTLETGNRIAIINCCFGTKVNETLSKIVSALLTARFGESVGVTTDPYRIIMELPRNLSKEDLESTFRLIRPGTVEDLCRKTVLNSSFLKWRFVYVAKKFGIIEKGADHRFMNFNRLFDTHQGTPAYNEAVNKVLWDDLDIPNTEKVVSMITNGEIQVVTGTVAPIGLEGLTRSKELMQPIRADHSILMAMKKRIDDELLFSTCMSCASQRRLRVGDAPKRLKCSNCGGQMIAVLKEYDRENVRLINQKRLTPQEKKELQRMSRNANLVREEGKRAVFTLAGRGIGPDSASRLLRGIYVDEDDFLRGIMAAEIQYAKTKRFWD
ncbi:MAG TPA: DEAD/DEAH box helicase [Candidatus Methanomethylophilaceae archaeon]|nr:DEAD/DEAH box helicase [Candidatus Methanomethylophilaceae archaeon]